MQNADVLLELTGKSSNNKSEKYFLMKPETTGDRYPNHSLYLRSKIMGRKLRGKDRLDDIENYIRGMGRVTVAELSGNWDITEETVRRDLDKLESKGVITRTHGGAVWNENNDSTLVRFYERQVKNRDSKHHIAVKAADLIESRTTIIADSGTTVMEAIREVSDHNNLNVVTNSVAIANELENIDFHLVLTGGIFNRHSMSMTGELARAAIRKYNASLALIGCNGIDMEKGILDSYENDVEVKRVMAEQADEVAVLVDHTKFGQVAFLQVIDMSQVNYIITDQKPSDEWMKFCKEKEIKLIF